MCFKMLFRFFFFVVLQSFISCAELSDRTTIMDHQLIRSLFHTFRDLEFNLVGRTGRRTLGNFLQEKQHKFPCVVKNMRSYEIPKSVHRLKPGNNKYTSNYELQIVCNTNIFCI